MPFCKKCKNSFPNRLKIDGKIKFLHRRSYCLDCSPFGIRSYKELSPNTATSKNPRPCVCKSCGRNYSYFRGSGHTTKRCNSCMANSGRHNLKRKCVKYKGGKCIKCGYNKCLAAFHFHHTNKGNKDFTISGSHTRKWKTLKEELDKCVLLCANCHSEEHYKPPREDSVSSLFL